jgi:hypothetical protein
MPDYEYVNPTTAEAESIEIRHLGDLVGEMAYRLSGCPALVMRKELQNAWADFATQTGALSFPAKASLATGRRKYGFAPPVDATVRAVRDIHLAHVDEEGHVTHHPSPWFWKHYSYANMGSVVSIVLDFDIDEAFLEADNLLLCKLECRPTIGSEDIPDFIFDKWARAIVAGAMSRLCSMPNRPWTDASVAAQSSIEYRNAMNEASLDGIKNRRGNFNVTNLEGWA